MIESYLIKYLLAQNFKCSLEYNSDNNVILQKTGGQLNDKQFIHTFAVQTYGNSKAASAKLSYDVLTKLLELPNNSIKIADLKLTAGPYDYTDTTTKEYRYQFVIDIYEF